MLIVDTRWVFRSLLRLMLYFKISSSIQQIIVLWNTSATSCVHENLLYRVLILIFVTLNASQIAFDQIAHKILILHFFAKTKIKEVSVVGQSVEIQFGITNNT